MDLPSPLEKLCIDDTLRNYCGEFGSWQKKHFILTSLAWALEAFHTMVMIFADREPEWQFVGGEPGKGSVCGLGPGTWEWVGGDAGSTVTEWGLVCGERYKVGLVQALFFGGSMIGAGVFGHLSDSSLGRKGSLTIVCILNAVIGCLTALAPNFWVYSLLRFVTGFNVGGIGLCAFVLSTEPVGPTKRGVVGMCTFYFFSGGLALLSGIAYLFPYWRALYVASSVPSVLFLIFVLPSISESPRWYLIRGKVDQAMTIMRNIAVANNKHLPEGVILVLDDESTRNNDEQSYQSKEATTGSLMDVLKSPITRIRLILSAGIYFLCSVVYYGLSLNVVNLGTNIYLNVFLNAIGEMPAFLLTAIFLDKFGRKSLTISTQWFSGSFCLIGGLVGGLGAWNVVRMVCGVLGIFGMAGTYNLLLIYTAELFPTVVRNTALGCACLWAQVGAIVTPFIVVLGDGLPFAVFGACAFLGGLLAFGLPETTNRPLYDTMVGLEEGEIKS